MIVARTFSKIAALAGMRLGYALAPKTLDPAHAPVEHGAASTRIVRYGGVAALKRHRVAGVGEEGDDRPCARRRSKDLASLGYQSIPSDANFFMVHLKRPVQPVIEEFKKKGVLVGRRSRRSTSISACRSARRTRWAGSWWRSRTSWRRRRH